MSLHRIALAAVLLVSVPGLAQQPLTPERQLARDVLAELVNINTTSDVIGTEAAAKAVVARLHAAGFSEDDAKIMGPDPKHSNVVIRLRGRSAEKPILLIAHLDVVPARREDWSMDPFTFVERDGYFYGRGVGDDKQGDANIIANMILWKRAGLVPEHDIVGMLSSDEETSGRNGIQWLVDHVPAAKQAAFALNADAGGGDIIDGKRTVFYVQGSEKIYADFEFTVRDRGGHSSLPRNIDNPIYRMAAALERLAAYQFPVNLNEITRTYFERDAALRPPDVAADMRAIAANKATPAVLARLSADPQFNALIRTTCTATMIDGGHATNALPQMARVNVNCRILPNDNPADVQQKLTEIFSAARPEMKIASAPKISPASPLRPEIMRVVEQEVAKKWPGTIVLPAMSTGATDGLFVRNAGVPVYGIEGEFADPSDSRAHGRDERILAQSFYDAVDFWHDVVPALAGSSQ